MAMKIIPVILSGGSGSRLWPLSRKEYPKQVINLLGDHSLFQDTLQRAYAVTSEKPLVISNYSHRFLIAEQAAAIEQGLANIILEPIARNTAPAIALAALEIVAKAGDGLMWVMPADHVVTEVAALKAAVTRAQTFAEQNALVTFGIEPTGPDTNYGYIQQGESMADGVFKVARFVEKPDQATAKDYLSQGGFSWNSGMFLFSVSTYLTELEQHQPEMLQACQKAYADAKQDLSFLIVDQQDFAEAPDISIDYAVMEKTDQAVVVPADLGWNDVGSWVSLSAVLPSDENDNVIQGDVLLHDVTNSYIRAENKLVAAVGLNNHVIVETDDAVLVAHKDDDQQVKKIVEQLKNLQRSEAVHHTTVFRPWGSHRRLIEASGVRVNQIRIKPGEAISMQAHQQRSEHWVVIRGIAQVQSGDVVSQLKAEESTFIPRGAKHQLKNIGEAELEVIEVQTGDYLGEDDVVRF